uniref:transcription factor bHLH118-like n=1 Tax=Erigeron canadensis TaxID=72917 RepID=UPI001CB8D83C|nr:transcription factor bHLH118-like [Erigeron canadensis]
MDLPNTKFNNNNNIMLSIQQGDDIINHDQTFLISFQQQEDHKPDLLIDHEHVISRVDDRGKSSINNTWGAMRRKNRKEAGNCKSNNNNNNNNLIAGGGGDGEDDNQTQKKMVHREIEKRRRQQMAQLYATLRDLLPLKLVKGNRSISDHMHQAVHYIKQMEENIKDLSIKRDKLKKSSDPNNESSMNYLPNNTVSVKFCEGGIEILINSCSIQDGFTLSRVLKALVVEGFSVTNCTLTEVNNRLLHSIRCEASDLALVDLSMLQQRLFSAANTQINFE